MYKFGDQSNNFTPVCRPGLLDYNVWPWFERMEAFHYRGEMKWDRFPEMVKKIIETFSLKNNFNFFR